MAAYLFFEYNIVNFRPVLINNIPEASYPSSTTVLVMCVMLTAIMQLQGLIKNNTIRVFTSTLFSAFTALTVIGRMLSGVHWLTDILGGILLSAALVMLYYSVTQYIRGIRNEHPN